MPEQEIEKIAEKANMTIAGFSYSMTEDRRSFISMVDGLFLLL